MHFHPFVVPEQVIPPQIETVKPWQMLDMPSDNIVKPGVGFVEYTNPYAVGTVASVAHPELKASLRIDIPFIDAVVI